MLARCCIAVSGNNTGGVVYRNGFEAFTSDEVLDCFILINGKHHWVTACAVSHGMALRHSAQMKLTMGHFRT